MPANVRVVATAGHVDHGKSSLILALTGMDPDRFAEEKRRGLTIDLGYAWCQVSSGREVGFVDVPGHERFVRNMLAGVGPVRLVLFVVAADEGWKPQSEEHLQIVDVLGLSGGVVALTKRDLVSGETFSRVEADVRRRIHGTVLDDAPIVAVSSRTAEGLEDVRTAIDHMVSSATAPERTRTRLHVDRVFPIKGAGTVVTGTLAGDCLRVGDEVELHPSGRRARVRSLQTHKRPEERACPIARVAANLAGVGRTDVGRGDVLARPGAWRSTQMLDGVLRPVRGLERPITSRGAYQMHLGAGETGVKIRFLEGRSLEPGATAYVRLVTARPVVADVFDRFVLRDAGRGVTVAGGIVLDIAPPRRPGSDAGIRLAARAASSRQDLPARLLRERGAALADEVERLTGSSERAGLEVGPWLVADDVHTAAADAAAAALASFHRSHPLEPGAPLDDVRRVVAGTLLRTRAADRARADHGLADPALTDALIERLASDGVIVRAATSVRLPEHKVALDDLPEEVKRLLDAVTGDREALPPAIDELVRSGLDRGVIDAAARAGVVVPVGRDLVMSPAIVERAVEVVRTHAADGVSVSELRVALGTTRKYAVPIAEYLDRIGVTRRDGDRRYPR
jgi:selenocysteine-specific elongation factor